MSDYLSLYKLCLRKVAIYLTHMIYKSYHENPFSAMPSSIINDLVAATIDLQPSARLRADDLELLLTSGRLQELKIHAKDYYHKEYSCQLLSQILRIFKSHCQDLQVLHLTASTQQSDVSKAIEDVLRNSPNLKDLVSRSSFDLKALRNCKKLRSVRLLFWPRQPWCDFLAKENDHLQQKKYLEFFTVGRWVRRYGDPATKIPCDDVVIILRHCPKLTSLGDIELSGVVPLLHKMRIPSSELKLRNYYYWDLEKPLLGTINDAMEYHLVIKELALHVHFLESLSCLNNLRNLVYLNISSAYGLNISEALRYALQEIGSGLKNLSFEINGDDGDWVDLSMLQYCPNLESLKILTECNRTFTSSAVQLPHLQRLCLWFDGCGGRDSDFSLGQIFPQFSGCNQLTDLFFEQVSGFDDKTLYCFLEKNSLSNLKVAYMRPSDLTELGLREFLLSAPQLESVKIQPSVSNEKLQHFKRVSYEINQKATWNGNSLSIFDEFFEKKSLGNSCCGR